MRIRLVPARLWRRLAGVAWSLRARRCLRRGDLAGAVRALQTSLGRVPGHAPRLLLLAEAHLRARETGEARRALLLAREADPLRFAREAPRLAARCGYEVEGLLRPPAPRPEPVPSPVGSRGGGAVRPAQLPYGDCRDVDEYARFRAMPPISRDEIDGMDLDHVLGDLLDD
jgi:hypothetical protein